MKLDRRTLIAGAPAALLLSRVAQAQSTATKPGTNDTGGGESALLAKFVVATRYEDLSPQVVEMTKRSILDAIGTSLAASGLEPACRAFVDDALEAGGKPQATILGMRARAPMAQAAFANGAFAHAMDYEDSHEPSRTHPNAATVAAALAVAESLGNVSGKELITAVAIGCDIVCRLALARRAAESRADTGFYAPAIVGTFGAAAAAGRLLKLDAAQMLDCFSLALCDNSISNEILESPDSHLRAVRDGFCAQSGATAARLAKRGVKGFDRPFEGKYAFRTMYGDGTWNRDALLAGLGSKFAGGDIAFKPWPSCRDTHMYIQAVLELLGKTPIDTDRIKSITAIVQERNLIVCEPAASKKIPRTAIDAKFSIYYTVARTLVYKQITFPSFFEDARKDPKTLALAAKVSYRIDQKQARPVSEGGGVILEIVMNDGTTHQRKVQDVSGSVGNPMSIEALTSKFIDCGLRAAQPASKAELQALSARVLALQDVADASGLIAKV